MIYKTINTRTLLLLFLALTAYMRVAAQRVEHGRESNMASVNFSDIVTYDLAHPPGGPMDLENEDDDYAPRPMRVPSSADSALIRTRPAPAHTSYSPPTPLLPISPSPTDTFEATLDNGTAIPPDTHGGVDANYCITAINTGIHIQTRAGANVSSVSLNSFYTSVESHGGTFDPRVHYDPYSNRWIIICVAGANNAGDTTCILIAVSKTSDPTGAYWMYRVVAYSAATYWLDYPVVGFNGKWICVTGNLFQNSPGTGYNGAKVFLFDKASVYSGAGAPYTAFTQSGSFTISPALTYDATEPNLFAVEVYNGGAGMMALWKITGAVGSESMGAGPIALPTSSSAWQSSSNQYTGTSGADFAPQAGTANKIQTNDDRVTQLVLSNGHLWFAHAVFLPYSSSVNATRSSVDWWELDTTGTPMQLGRIDDATNTNFYAFPTMAVNSTDDALIGFSTFSSSTYASSAYALRMHTDATDSVRPQQVYRHGQASYYKTFSGTKNRWGDYSGTVMDPTNLTDFWTIQEAAASPSNTWDTWWANVKLCNPPSAITGTVTVCAGSTTVLTDATAGGTWSSSNTSVATMGTSGIATGVAGGTTIITYTVAGGCTATTTLTVNPLPGSIAGTTSVCVGSNTNLTDAGGGTWVSGNTSVATVGATGVVGGVAIGTSIVTYTLSTGCATTTTITASAAPGAITGAMSVCSGSATNLTDAGGGTWSSSNTAVATAVTGTGVITGVGAGTATITYSLGTGCTATAVVTVLATPSAVLGTPAVCSGQTTSLSDATGSGAWTSSSTAVATVAGGTVGGVSAGTSTISYTIGGCAATVIVTVNATPPAILGTTSLCTGANASLSDVLGGGAWSSSNTTVATISGTGLAGGVAAGTSAITYAEISGCYASTIVTVDASPAPLSGTNTACVGMTTSLSDAVAGGVWSSSNTAVATVAGGTVGGVAPGTSTIAYTLGSCAASMVVTVNPAAGPIVGTAAVCTGAATSLSDAVGGGAWSSGATGIATVSATGTVGGVSAGTSAITYTVGAGCYVTTVVTVNLTPLPISGSTAMCVGGVVSLSDIVGGGAWSSSSTSTATVDGFGNVTGVAIGTSNITYTLSSGCNTSVVVTVIPATAGPIAGSASVCAGQTITLSDATGGGVWTSANTAVATAGGGTGIITGVSAGTTTISYTVITGCGTAVVTTAITVNAAPTVAAITGTAAFCSTSSTTLSDATPSGTWSSGNTAVATAAATGVVSGVSPGTAPISYTVTNGAGCSASAVKTVTVTAPPVPVVTPASATTFCTGGYVTLNSSTVAGATYQWQFGGANIAGATTSSYTATTAMGTGTYDVVMTTGSGCIGTSAGIVVTVSPFPIDIPSVSISASPGTTLCAAASSVTFTPIPLNGGATPSYQWYVNGSAVSTASTYSYSPASGDIVKLLMTSSDICAFPDTANASVTMTISPAQTPSVAIVPNPADTVCADRLVTLFPAPVFGGSRPVYAWAVNGTFVTSGSSYGPYNPHNGDKVSVIMNSNYFCLATPAAYDTITLHTSPMSLTSVTIGVADTIIASGQTDTFIALTPGGLALTYQWYIGLSPVPGATSNMFVTTSLSNNDFVSCHVTSGPPCDTSVNGNTGAIHVLPSGVQKVIAGTGTFTLMPNPNSGIFTISGSFANLSGDVINIRVINVLGQTVYAKSAQLHNGEMNERVLLADNIPGGMYLVNVSTGEEHATFHVIVKK